MLPLCLRDKMSETPKFSCNYKYLTADQCESLKKSVKDREQEFVWGSFSPEGPDEDGLEKSTLDKLTTQHLENILLTQCYISMEYKAAILMLLKKRYDFYGAMR